MKKNRRLYFAVTGTIGSGKTTAARLLAKHLKLRLIEENFGENAFLARFYKDMKRWAFHSQTFFLMEKITQMLAIRDMLSSPRHPDQFADRRSVEGSSVFRRVEDSSTSPPAGGFARNDMRGIVQDTPIYQDVFSYAKALHVMGNMDDAEWRLYQKIYRSFVPYLPKPDVIIYLKTSLESVKKRMSTRNRSFEQSVPEGYLELLEMLNEAWMRKETDGAKIITIETDGLNLVKSQTDKQTFMTFVRKELI